MTCAENYKLLVNSKWVWPIPHYLCVSIYLPWVNVNTHLAKCLNGVLNVIVLVGAFNQEKALVPSRGLDRDCKTAQSSGTFVWSSTADCWPCTVQVSSPRTGAVIEASGNVSLRIGFLSQFRRLDCIMITTTYKYRENTAHRGPDSWCGNGGCKAAMGKSF